VQNNIVPNSPKWSLWYIASLLSYGTVLGIVYIAGTSLANDPRFFILYGVLYASMLGIWHFGPEKRNFPLLFVLAIIARLAFLRFPASDDVNRYVWEGIIQNEGFNPFVYAPNAPALAHLRDSLWEQINHPHYPTIYWPFAQILFKVVAAISPAILSFKIVFILFDLAAAFVLVKILKHLQADIKHSILYLLNPLMLTYIAGEGHLESVLVFWLTLALWAHIKKTHWLFWLSMGMAVMTKTTAVIFLPFFVSRNKLPWAAVLFVPLSLTLLYISSEGSLFSVLFSFSSTSNYNGLLFMLFQSAGLADHTLLYCAIAAGIACVCIFFFSVPTTRALYLATVTFFLCTPIFHPWYLLMALPFIVLYRPPAVLTLNASIIILLFRFYPHEHPQWFHTSTIVFYIEYLPFLLVVFWQLVQPVKYSKGITRYTPPETVSVIIPAFNEEMRIESCLDRVVTCPSISEIIVVDGGSSDKTLDRVKRFSSVTLLHSKPGRGTQISKGIRSATGDIILILHADSHLQKGAVPGMLRLLQKHPDIVGGAFAAEYDNSGLMFRFNEFLNNGRVRLTGISFGDQAQFFRRELRNFHYPAQKLMEDIELSMRLKEQGGLAFLPHGVTSSTRMWKKSGYLTNFITVITLTSYYLLRRKFGLLKPDCSDFYAWYYGKK